LGPHGSRYREKAEAVFPRHAGSVRDRLLLEATVDDVILERIIPTFDHFTRCGYQKGAVLDVIAACALVPTPDLVMLAVEDDSEWDVLHPDIISEIVDHYFAGTRSEEVVMGS
jgi:hypothetical protein